MKLSGFFDEVVSYKDTIKRYISEIEARYQSRIAEFLALKDELYTLRSVIVSSGLNKDAQLAETYGAQAEALIEEQLRLEQSSVNVISTISGIKGSTLYAQVMNPSGDLLNDAAYYLQAAQLARDATALLSNWNTVNNEMSAHVAKVQQFSNDVRGWLGLPKNMLSAFPWNNLILPAGIVAAGLILFRAIPQRGARTKK